MSKIEKLEYQPNFKIIGRNGEFKLGMVVHNISTKKEAEIMRDKIKSLLKGVVNG